MKTRLAWLFVAFVASSVPARAAPDCMTLAQARAAHPGKYLTYRLVNHKPCWDDHGPIHRSVAKHRNRPQTLPVPVSRQTVLWPTLATVVTPVDAALLNPLPGTQWPLLLDVDEVTAPVADASGNTVTADVCCWPPLEAEFSERWSAVPATWFFSALKLEF